MSRFRQTLNEALESALKEAGSDGAPDSERQWLYVPYDQLSDGFGPLSREKPGSLGIVLVESLAKGRRRPYHKQKLALVLANMRHFALEQARRGVAVRYLHSDGSYVEALESVVEELGPLAHMRPFERELRVKLRPLVESGALTVLPHEGELTTPEDFASLGTPPWRMDAFYRRVRKRTGILMEDGKPVGGKYSFDAENRNAWKGEPPAPALPVFEPDAVTREVAELVNELFADHPGRVDLAMLPATRTDAERFWGWAKNECLPTFGPYEDAMSREQRTLFHSRLSPLINLHRLLPGRILDEVLSMDLPLASKEGFVRQLIGWREFMRHVHEVTDGFRRMPGAGKNHAPVAELKNAPEVTPEAIDGGACPSRLGEGQSLPPAFWGAKSGLNCLDTVVESVVEEGWSHHITRLMVLSNLSTLLDCSPRELTDWFWEMYIDAYDWVVEPNVLGMGTFAVGELFTTKPYVCGSNYIHKMSDYCDGCAFHPKKTCPIAELYWAFLARHADTLDGNRRLAMPLRSLKKRSADKRERDQRVFEWCRATLEAGETLRPEGLPA